METLKNCFGGLNLTWKKVILAAIAAGAYTALMALLPAAKDTSFADITISFEVWILFGVLLIMNSRSPLDSALKCFVFFLISQPLVYLLQVPFSALGWGIFTYYRYWFLWTLLTIPMGLIGYYLKKQRWWGLLILTPVLLLLGVHLARFLTLARFAFPRHLLSALFCLVTLFLYPLCIFDRGKVRTAGLVISALIVLGASGYAVTHPNVYRTTLLVSGGSAGAVFDDSCRVSLEDARFGTVQIVYDAGLEDYMVNAALVRGGKTRLILEDGAGRQTVFALDIGYSSFDIQRE